MKSIPRDSTSLLVALLLSLHFREGKRVPLGQGNQRENSDLQNNVS